MIIIERKELHGIPFLQVEQESLKNEALATVIYYHGFNGEKESSLTISYKMAEKGLRVILPDAPQHGERAVSEDAIEHGLNFWHIVLEAVEEVEQFKDYLKNESLLLHDKLGLAGTSMGGMITYASLKKYDWITSAAVLMGTPYLTKRAEHTISSPSDETNALLEQIRAVDITRDLAALGERSLFIWHGEKDEIVPVTDSRDFYRTLVNEKVPEERLQFIEEKERIHNISKLSIKKTAEWFACQL
ncbi:MAG TPA: alpha/beta fold hydrolase [Pseudogracilibacillus sp.]|nr:alpha/beta fold hydrolase [Pseudogracilibacillus sp.]